MGHIWVGGYYSHHKWLWWKTKEPIPAFEIDGYPPWIVNETYAHYLERENVCLNMDRENHIKAMFYGTTCHYPQAFICQFGKYDKIIHAMYNFVILDASTLCNGTKFTTITEKIFRKM